MLWPAHLFYTFVLLMQKQCREYLGYTGGKVLYIRYIRDAQYMHNVPYQSIFKIFLFLSPNTHIPTINQMDSLKTYEKNTQYKSMYPISPILIDDLFHTFIYY